MSKDFDNSLELEEAYKAGVKPGRLSADSTPIDDDWKLVANTRPPQGRYLAYPNTVGEIGTALYWPDTNMWQDLEDHTEPWTPTHWAYLPAKPEMEGK